MKKIIIIALLIAPISIFAQKFGHFNTQDIISVMPEYAAAEAEVQALGQQYQKELQKMEEEFNNKVKEFQAMQDSASVPEAILKRHSQTLQALRDNFLQTQESAQEDIDKLRTEKLTAIQQKILTAVEEIGKAGGYVYIMDKSAGIPYVSTTLSTDVTAELKAKLGIK